MIVRQLTTEDFEDAHALYKELVGDISVPDGSEGQARFQEILDHPGTFVIGAEHDGHVRAMVTLHILPNMTFGGRSYAVIENVVTARAMQGRGLGRAVMEDAVNRAWGAGAYKVMLLTGQTAQAKGFYERIGFNASDKHGMILRRAPQRTP